MQVFDVAALGAGDGPPELGVEILDVQGEDFLGAGRGLVQHPPQHSFPKVVAVVGQQLRQPGVRDGLVAPLGDLPALQVAGRVEGEPVLSYGVGGEGPQRGQVLVPRRGGPLIPRSITAALQLLRRRVRHKRPVPASLLIRQVLKSHNQ